MRDIMTGVESITSFIPVWKELELVNGYWSASHFLNTCQFPRAIHMSFKVLLVIALIICISKTAAQMSNMDMDNVYVVTAEQSIIYF